MTIYVRCKTYENSENDEYARVSVGIPIVEFNDRESPEFNAAKDKVIISKKQCATHTFKCGFDWHLFLECKKIQQDFRPRRIANKMQFSVLRN